jgi:hypothetical protein
VPCSGGDEEWSRPLQLPVPDIAPKVALMLPACRVLPRGCGRRWAKVVLQIPGGPGASASSRKASFKLRPPGRREHLPTAGVTLNLNPQAR